jgi:fructose-bisphosphate aldolase class I
MFDLSEVARDLVAPGKGILAADESNKSADEKRLAQYGIATGPEMRREFRDMLLETPGIEKHLSGVILFSETLDQKDDEDGLYFPESLKKHGILPGIKVDEGLEPFPDSPDETITKGLVGLSERVLEFKNKHHPGFTKWRAAITIDGDRLPTTRALVENAKRLAIYAREVQKAGMVPIVEPEVLLDGNHSRLRCREVITKMMQALIAAMEDQAVDMSAVIIKTSMALSGKGQGDGKDGTGKKGTAHQDTPEEVAEDTLSALMETIPAVIPGIVFLSGGQSPDEAIANLAAITKLARAKNAPWPLTYSYARAFQEEAIIAWAGKPENVPAAREAFTKRLEQASAAILS